MRPRSHPLYQRVAVLLTLVLVLLYGVFEPMHEHLHASWGAHRETAATATLTAVHTACPLCILATQTVALTAEPPALLTAALSVFLPCETPARNHVSPTLVLLRAIGRAPPALALS